MRRFWVLPWLGLLSMLASAGTLTPAPASPLQYSQTGVSLQINDAFALHAAGYADFDTSYFSNNPLDVRGDSSMRRIKTYQALIYDTRWGIYFSEDWLDRANKLDNTFVGYSSNQFQLALGQASPAFGLNNTAAYQGMSFSEYALPADAFSPGYGVGIYPSVNNNQWVLQLSANSFRLFDTYEGHPPYAYTIRGFYSPFHQDGRVLHLGFSFWQQYPDGTQTESFGTIPEATTASFPQFVTTGNITDVAHFQVSDLEFGWEHASFTLTAEVVANQVNRTHSQPDLFFSGYYVAASYFLTGEHLTYSYPGGYFYIPSPIRHRYGAFQLATRFSHVNLNSGQVQGGDESNATLGINWYLTPRVNCKLDYIHVWNGQPVTNHRAQFNIVLLRLEAGAF